MDSTRRVLSNIMTVIAAGLGAVVAVPLAALLAAAFYLRAAVLAVIGFTRMLGTFPDRAEPGVPPAKPDRPPDRLAS